MNEEKRKELVRSRLEKKIEEKIKTNPDGTPKIRDERTKRPPMPEGSFQVPDLFKDKNLIQMRENLDEKTAQAFTKMGEEMYSDFNMEVMRAADPNDVIMKQSEIKGESKTEGVAFGTHEHLKVCLRSGLLPSHLTGEEIKVFERNEGPEWYKNYGYNEFLA